MPMTLSVLPRHRRETLPACARRPTNGTGWLISRTTQAPGSISTMIAAKKTRFLFSAHPQLDRAPLVPMEAIVVKARDGLNLVCYLSRPRIADNAVPLPMVLLVHGGPWSRDEWGLNVTHQWLANRGYAVLSVRPETVRVI